MMRYQKDERGFSPIVIILALVILLAGAVGVFLWRKNSDKKAENTNQEATQESSSDQTEETAGDSDAPAKETLIDYVDIRFQDTNNLSDMPEKTPESFVSFIKNRIEGFDCDFAEFPTGGIYLTMVSDRFVQGGISCGGGAAVTWYFQNNEWHEFGYQDTVPCQTVAAYEIPSEFIPECREGEVVVANPNGPLEN